MTCPACGADNRDGARFCGECAAPLVKPVACPGCGATNPGGRKFCDACGIALAGRTANDAVVRKVVTIVFADLIGSTSLHERLDPESVSRVMDRYHRAVRVPVEAHGGTVVQLLGDGVMCAFGVPRVAEDDAIRAVRAAVGIQRSFREFAREEHATVGDVGLRVAVNTGEVVVTDDYTAGIGDPLNVAARLQQEAHAGDVLISESTRRLVSELVTLEPFGVLSLKGRAETVSAYRVVSLERAPGASATPFVGRDDELRRVMSVYDAAVASRRARLAVVLGSPGLGKSRLMDEVARRLGDGATVLTAHCDAAGGATFAPIAKALRAHLRIDEGTSGDALRARIEAAMPGDEAERNRLAGGIAGLLGGTPASPEETFFVVRRFLAALASAQPLVLVIDDLHWAEPLLLDLVEHLIQWSTDVPLLVLAAARPELREARSSLAVPAGLVTDVVTLAGLDAAAATRLAANVIGADQLPAAVAGRVLATSEGNPLFVGELVRMLVADGALKREGDRWTTGVELARLEMPPTIQALLAARIERLRPEERTVLERAAVVGRQFSRAAVTHLLPRETADLDARLEALRRSELIEPDTGWYLGEPALRFHHMLIRDAAYRRLLKNTRAELHARFADWLEGRVGDAVEHDETMGWHLEQAHQNLRELGPVDERGRTLGERAARYLAAAGRRALARDDLPLAASLLGRALDRLDTTDPARADLTLDWCEALLAAGDVGPAAPAIEDLGRFAGESPRLRAWHICFAGQLAALTDPQTLRATADAVAAAAETLAAAGDAAGEAKAHSVHAIALGRLGRVGACEAALDRALAAARRADDRRRSNAVLASAPLAALWGPSPVTRASGRCLDVVRVLRITQGAPAVEAVALRCQGVLEALRGRTEAARRMLASSRHMVEELGITQRLLEADVFTGLVDLLEDDAAAAERTLRAAYDGLREHGLGIDAAQAAALLGRALLALGRADEAETASHESEALAGDDLKAAIAWRGVRAEALARRGEHAAAVDFARTAVDIAAATDALLDHADARLALAAALRAAGRSAEAAAEEQRAIELWDAKGATLLAERARRGIGRVMHEDRVRNVRAQPARPARRRLLPNAATAFTARFDAAIAARDTDAIATLYADEMKAVSHPTGTVVDRQGALDGWRLVMRGENLTYRHEPLATLGDSLVLSRTSISGSRFAGGKFDVAAYERQEIALIEVDSNGRLGWAEDFADDRLGDAVVRLYERYAERLPDGPARTRAATTARAVAAIVGPVSFVGIGSIFAPDFEFVDHRPVGLPSSRGREVYLRSLGSLLDLVDDMANRADDVLCMRPDSFLLRITNLGRERTGGGAFERPILLLSIFDADGLATRWEFFDPTRDAEALARFDELTAAPSRAADGRERRVRPNAATAMYALADAALAARDADAIVGLTSDGFEVVDHTTGVVYDRQGYLATIRVLLKAEHPSHARETLATLGDSLALCREATSASRFVGRTFDVGAYEKTEIVLVEVDAQGRYRRRELFAPSRLGGAVVRLYERYAEILPDGAERVRAAATAHSVAGMEGPLDLARSAAVLDSSIESIDHRTLGTWSSRGAEAFMQNLRAWPEVAESVTLRIDDVLAVRPDAFLGRWMNFGTDRVGGGTFERPYLRLVRFGADGRLTRSEVFDVDRDTEALARFDELAGGPPAPAVPSSFHEPSRRVRPNAATAHVAAVDAAFAARNAGALPTLVTDQTEVVHHPTGSVYGRDGLLATWRRVMRAPDSTQHNEPLATLADSLGLFRHSVSASGVARGNFDIGPYELDVFFLIEVDAQARCLREEVFATDRLGDAITRLYERYAELLPDGPERVRAAATAHSAVLGGPYDLDRFATGHDPDIEYVDRRTLGLGSAHGAEAVIQLLGSMLEVADDVANRVDDVLALRSDGLLVRWMNFGTDRAGGGPYERPFLWLGVFGPNGLLTRIEQFDVGRETEALARFDELTAGPVPSCAASRRHAVRRNAATAISARIDAAVAARDEDALATLVADSFEVIDHATGATYGRTVMLTTWRGLMKVPDLTYRQEPAATLGDSLAMCRLSTSAPGIVRGSFDVGPYLFEEILLVEADPHGRARRAEVFRSDRLGDALARLCESYADALPDGPARARAAATARSIATLVGPVDLDRYNTAIARDLAFFDHKTLGWGSVRGAEAFLGVVGSLLEVSSDTALRIDDVLGIRPDAVLVRCTNFGTDRASRGAYERQYLMNCTFDADGLVGRWEQFDPDRDDEALACFEESTTAPSRVAKRRPRRVRANAATASDARIAAAVAARDGDALAAVFAEDLETVEHPTGSVIDREGTLRGFRSLLTAREPAYWQEPLASLGDTLALSRVGWSASGLVGGGFDVGAYESEAIYVVEVDALGRRRRTERFRVERLGDAVARLYERYAELLPDGPGRDRIAATARSVAAMVGPIEVARWAPALAPTLEFADHRHISLESGRGADAYLRALQALLDVTEVSARRIDDVLALRPDAVLVHQMHFGTARVGGGAFERPNLGLGVFGPDGLMTRLEFFEIDDEDRALARFDELTAEPVAAPSRVAERRVRRVRANAASENTARTDMALAARDGEALTALIADRCDVTDHVTGTTYDRQGVLRTWRSFLTADHLTSQQEPLATLGESLVLVRQLLSARGVARGNFDVGPYEMEHVHVHEVDAQGRRQWSERFACGRLGDAVVRLYERYAELLPDGPARVRAATTARSVAAYLGRLDVDRMLAAVVPGIEYYDHRHVGFGAMHGIQEFGPVLRSLFEAVDDAAYRVDDVVDLRPDAGLLRLTNFGTDRASGGPYERPYLLIWVSGPDGLWANLEQFDVDHEPEALARFDELTGEAPAAPLVRRRVRPNAATAAAARVDAAIAARDVDAILAVWGEGGLIVDHTGGAEYGAETLRRTWRSVFRARDVAHRRDDLATLGDSLALFRTWLHASSSVGGTFDVGPYEIEQILLNELDTQGRCRRSEIFGADRLGDAIVRLYERYAELLPDGPARARAAATARAAADHLGPLDLDRMVSAVAPDVEFHDHRTLIRSGLMRGVQVVRDSLATLFDAAADVANRVDDVLGLRPDATLLRVTNAGTIRASGGAYERPFLLLWVFGADGLMTHTELFDVGHEGQAIARFDELTGEPAAMPFRAPAKRNRRVRPNAATANAARIDAAMGARDADVLRSLLADQAEMIDHTTGATYDQRGSLFTWSSLLNARDPTFGHEPLATLGASLALFRQTVSASGFAGRTFDVGAYEREGLLVVQVDADGRRQHAELYASHQLGDAVVRLYERHAEILPAGTARDRAAATARSVAATHGPVDPDRHATAWSPAIEVVDHRILGTWAASGAEEYRQVLRSLLEVADDPVLHDDDILCLSPDALLMRRTHCGTARAGGGLYERSFLMLRVFDTDGLFDRFEFFDADREDEALARVDALSTPQGATRMVAAPSSTAARRVRPNTATAHAARFDAVIAAGDQDSLPALFADVAEFVERPTGAVYDREGVLFTMRAALRARELSYRHEPLATLGEALALCRVWMSASGLKRGKFDIGAYETEHLDVIEVDAQGKRRWVERLASDRLGDAVARMYERYAELLPAGPARERAAGTARSVTTYTGPYDPDRYAAAWAPDIEVVDSRILGTMSTKGAEAFLANYRSWLDLANDTAFDEDEVLGLQSHALLWRRTFSGIDRAGGGAFERQFIQLWTFGTDGSITRIEYFDADREDLALARFDELTAEPPAPARIENAATRAISRFAEAWEARDWERVAEDRAPEFHLSDRRTMMHMELDREQHLASLGTLFQMTECRLLSELLATRGERLALFRQRLEGSDRNAGPIEAEWLWVLEMNDRGEHIAAVMIDPDDLDAAYAELDARYFAGEAAPFGHAKDVITFKRSFAARDWDGVASMLAPDYVLVDHRPLGWGTLDGPTYVESLKALADLAPDTEFRIDHCWVSARAQLRVILMLGTREGGAFEEPRVNVFELDDYGRIRRQDFYALDQLDEARARFAALRPDPLRIPPNAATRVSNRHEEALGAGDMKAFALLCAPTMVFDDRRRAVLLTGDRDMFVASSRLILSARGRASPTLLATAGDRLSLEHLHWTGGAPGQEWDLENLSIHEVDAEGRTVAIVAFDADDRCAASKELLERYARSDAGRWMTPAGVDFRRGMLDHDPDRIRGALPDDFVFHDHRRTGPGRLEGRDAFLAWVAALFEESSDAIIEPFYYLATGEHVFVAVGHTFGTLAEGGAFEFVWAQVGQNQGGRPVAVELFEVEDLDAALARYEALRTELAQAPRDPLRIPPNAATRASDRHAQALEARDWDAQDALCAPTLEFDDRRKGVLTTGGRDMFIASGRLIGRAETRTERTFLATAGDRLMLEHVRWIGADHRVPFEVDNLSITEVDAEGRIVAVISFDPDDRRAASKELLERYVRSDAGRWMSPGQADFRRAMFDHDVGRMRAALCDDYVFHDHRRTGPGRLEGPDGYLAWLGTLFEQSSDAIIEPLYYIATDPRGPIYVAAGHTLGTSNDGGEFESVFVQVVFHRGGRVAGAELFELDDLDAALARYEALRLEFAQAPADAPSPARERSA